MTTATPAEARAQMPCAKPGGVDFLKLETGGSGSAYVKVWLGRALYLWYSFEPGTDSEGIAYERAVQSLSDNPGSKAVVSVQCAGACKWFDLVCKEAPTEKPTTKRQLEVLREMLDGKPRSFRKESMNTGVACLKKGFMARVKGSDEADWLLVITEAGRAEVGNG
jgi:hypothetical protein